MKGTHITIIMKPTNQCNLRCKYCYHAENGYDTDRMSDEILEKSIAATLPYYDNIEYNWHGGEPLIMGIEFYKKVIYYQNKYKISDNQHIINTMQTNGTLMNLELARFLKDNNFGIGLSFDGPFNEEIRGMTSGTLSAYKLLKDIGKKHGTISVIGRHNIDKLIDLYQYFKDMGVSFKYSPMFDSGEAKNHSDLLLTEPEYYAKKICEFFDYWMNDKEGTIEVRPFAAYVSSYFTKRMKSCTKGHCLYHMASIYHDGSVYPCGRSYPNDYCIGNILEVNDLHALFDNDIYRSIINGRAIRETKCKEQCDIFSYCNSGCNNDSILAGNIEEPDMFQCISHKIILAHIHNRIKEIISERKMVNPCVYRIIRQYIH